MARKKSAAKKAREETEKLKQQELQEQVEEKSKDQSGEEFSSDEESSSSEEEDDFGELITEDVEDGINKVLDAIRSGDKTLFDPKVKFFNESETKDTGSKKEKPIYLKDYHRMRLLNGEALNEDEDDSQDIEEPAFRTYDQEQEDQRKEFLSELNNAMNDDEEDEDDEGFLKKKETTSEDKPKRVLPNPNEDEEKFLQEFAAQHAWIPQKGDKIINLDNRGEEDDEEFDDAVEEFEHAYNHRFEDPTSADIISYARNKATIRRDTNSRKKQRELKKEEAQKLKKEKDTMIAKKKNEKINKLADILEQIKNDYGAEINEDMIKRISESLLDKDFDDSKWDTLLQDIFNDQFYNDDAVKPQWDSDDEIMKDFKPNDGDAESDEQEEQQQDADETEEPVKKKVKKDQLKEKNDKKKEKRRLKELAEKAVEANKLKIIDQVEEEREGRSKEKKDTFKYREVSPETFGLTTRDILVADDLQLNEYVGLKKYAAYRPKDQRVKDRRKLAKSKQLKEWRKKVFKNEDGPQVDEEDKDGDIKIPIPEPIDNKKRKSNKRKHEKLMD